MLLPDFNDPLEREIPFEVLMLKASLFRCIIRNNLAVPDQVILVNDQTFKSDGASGMQFAGTDAYLCTKSVFIAVAEPG